MSEGAWAAATASTQTRVGVVRMGEFTANAGKWLGEASEQSIVLLRHGRPVALLRPPERAQQALEKSVDSIDATYFARNAKQVINHVAASGQPQVVTKYGKPLAVVQPLRVRNFDGLVLANALDELTAGPPGKAVPLSELAAGLDLDEH